MPPAFAPQSTLADTPNAAIFRLTDADVQEFRALVQKATGLWMTPEEAAARAYALLTLARIIVDQIKDQRPEMKVQTSSTLHDSCGHSRVGS